MFKVRFVKCVCSFQFVYPPFFCFIIFISVQSASLKGLIIYYIYNSNWATIYTTKTTEGIAASGAVALQPGAGLDDGDEDDGDEDDDGDNRRCRACLCGDCFPSLFPSILSQI